MLNVNLKKTHTRARTHARTRARISMTIQMFHVSLRVSNNFIRLFRKAFSQVVTKQLLGYVFVLLTGFLNIQMCAWFAPTASLEQISPCQKSTSHGTKSTSAAVATSWAEA